MKKRFTPSGKTLSWETHKLAFKLGGSLTGCIIILGTYILAEYAAGAVRGALSQPANQLHIPGAFELYAIPGIIWLAVALSACGAGLFAGFLGREDGPLYGAIPAVLCCTLFGALDFLNPGPQADTLTVYAGLICMAVVAPIFGMMGERLARKVFAVRAGASPQTCTDVA